MKVQAVVRSMPWMVWKPGWSICYRDVSYTRTKKTIRFKFDSIETTAFAKPYDIAEADLAAKLAAAGHTNCKVQVLPHMVCVWQTSPITITEEAVA